MVGFIYFQNFDEILNTFSLVVVVVVVVLGINFDKVLKTFFCFGGGPGD